MEKIKTVWEAAKYACRSERTIRRWQKQGLKKNEAGQFSAKSLDRFKDSLQLDGVEKHRLLRALKAAQAGYSQAIRIIENAGRRKK